MEVYGRDFRAQRMIYLSDSHSNLIALAVKVLRYRYDIVATEFSPYRPTVPREWVVFDFIAFTRRSKEIRVIECKATRADFLADKKWERYLPYCTHLAFLGPPEAFSKHELPAEIGIIRPRPDRPYRPWQYERGCRRLHEVGEREYLAILEGLVGCYSRCLWTCPGPEKRQRKFGQEW